MMMKFWAYKRTIGIADPLTIKSGLLGIMPSPEGGLKWSI